ncbi:MAG: hypothetical protein JWM58_2291 [Rhizobium sp.]|nr:hypothetical protein [Rhizobium sp.]
MTTFYIQALGRDLNGPVEAILDCSTIDDAKAEARRVLAEIAAGGLPKNPMDMLSVELFDVDHRPIMEVRLILEEIDK